MVELGQASYFTHSLPREDIGGHFSFGTVSDMVDSTTVIFDHLFLNEIYSVKLLFLLPKYNASLTNLILQNFDVLR